MEIELWFRMKIKVKGNQHNFIKWIIFDIVENVFISAVVFAELILEMEERKICSKIYVTFIEFFFVRCVFC